ncbi:MAG: ferritin family protein [Candidatus Thermoplasmatota archaeon]|nr:ferritin family protein [Candidatus Thermoplasmatota archaeon]MBU1941047.1 ferritin family protein [Candidatus Thermoplasmatota archaeon]
MSFDFSADEIFEIAVEIERNGAKFYRLAADSVTDADKKKLLIQLAEMEDEHEETFKALRNQLAINEKVLATFDPEGEAEGYLRALADTRVFYEKKIDKTSLKEIFKAAITAEKDSIVFYLGMKDVVPAHFGKQRLDDIIKEEMSHIRLLSNELMALS